MRRIGSTGTFNLIGPASAAGSNNTTQVTYSAVNTTTGVITITNIGANRIAGCFVAADGVSDLRADAAESRVLPDPGHGCHGGRVVASECPADLHV